MITTRLHHWRFLHQASETSDQTGPLFNFTFLKNFFNLPVSARHVLTSHAIYNLGVGIGSAFINYFLLRQLTSLREVALFTLLQFPALLLGYFLVSILKGPLISRNIIRMAIIFALTFFISLILFRNQISNLILPLGFIFGISQGLFWGSQNILEYLTTNNSNRDNYYSYDFAATAVASVVIPLVSALILGQNFLPGATIITNYYILFALAFIILALSFIYTFKLPTIIIPRVTFDELKNLRHHPHWGLITVINFLDGLKWDFEALVLTYLTFQILKEEATIGNVNALFALLMAIAAVWLSKKIKPHNRNKLLLISSISLLFANIIFVQMFSFFGVIIYLLLNIIFSPLLNTTSTSAILEIVGTESAKTEFNSWMLWREICLNICRFAGVGIFILALGFLSPQQTSSVGFVISGVFAVLSALLVSKITSQTARKG